VSSPVANLIQQGIELDGAQSPPVPIAGESRPPTQYSPRGTRATKATSTTGACSQRKPSPTTDKTPSSSEARRRLSKFTTDVKTKRSAPLLSSPPLQKAPTKPALPHRSRRIAAQPLGHIPASKHGEMLLMQRIGVIPPQTLPSAASKQSFDSFFKGNISSSDVEALDVLFPAVSTKAGRATRRPMATAA
jgi:hypothetical protein